VAGFLEVNNISILVLGRAIWDDWQDLEHQANANFGGSGANIAVHLAHLGLDVTLHTVLGTCWRSRVYAERLRMVGVATEHVVYDDAPLTRCILYREKSEFSWGDGGDGLSKLAALNPLHSTDSFDAVIVADYPVDALSASAAQGTFWCLGPHQSVLTCASTIDGISRLPWTRLFTNRREAQLLSGLGLRSGQRWIITNGPLPVIVLEPEQEMEEYIVPPASLRCPVGGGDAFLAGYVAAELRGYGASACVTAGLNAAKQIVESDYCQQVDLSWKFVAP
jgi:sugar/nucleoside kinase (ribokinase family)